MQYSPASIKYDSPCSPNNSLPEAVFSTKTVRRKQIFITCYGRFYSFAKVGRFSTQGLAPASRRISRQIAVAAKAPSPAAIIT